MASRIAAANIGTHFVVVPHTHWDREWYRPFEDFRRRLVRLVNRLLDILDSDPAFRCFHFDGQTIVLDDYVAIRPQNETRLRHHLKAGRIRIGPWRVLPDEFLVTGEALIRNLQQGHADCARWGVEPLTVGYTPDQFGHVGVLPQILSGFGLTAGVVWRGVGPDVTRTQFLWESPDGTQLFTIYLPGGYGNGASLPERVEPLLERLDNIRREQQDFCDIRPLLVMNGSDHLEPQAAIPHLLETVMERRPTWSFEMGGIESFVAQAQAAAGDLDVHRGEFRHPWRANILPGVTSVRSYQKQTDFEVCRLFEKYVEPLSAWAHLLGDRGEAQDFIDYAWRLMIENHPHDSICGCSVDAVHDEMDTRWAKVLQVGRPLLREALQAVGAACATDAVPGAGEDVLLTYAAARPDRQAIDLNVYLDDPAAVRGLTDIRGGRHPVQVTAGEPELFFETHMPADMLRTTVAGMEGREVLGYYLNNLFVERIDGRLTIRLVCGYQPYGEPDIEGKRAELLELLRAEGSADVHVLGVSASRARLQAVVPVGGQTALDAFGLSDEPADETDRAMSVSARRIETPDLVVTVADDASVSLTDKRAGTVWPRILCIEDEGDRGDTYNFDPVPGGEVVRAPRDGLECSVVVDGAVAATVAVQYVYSLPRSVTADRRARSAERVDVPITLELTCWKALPRLDVRVTVTNHARDHRMRAVVDLPFAPTESIAEGPFGVVRRPAELPDMAGTVERFYGTAPTKGFVCAEAGEAGLAVFTRGLQEYEVSRTDGGGRVAISLLRCVGWLSRDDLEMRNHNSAGPKLETPGAQSQRTQTFEFALYPYGGDYAAAGVPAQAHAYAYPPVGARASRHAGAVAPGTALVQASDPGIVVSAITRTQDREAVLFRTYNEGETAIDATLHVWDGAGEITACDLRERATDGAGGLTPAAQFTPSQIRSWRASPRAVT